MYEEYLIPVRGFKNIARNNRVVGFCVNLRPNDQRGESASLIDAIELRVDGENFTADQMTVTIGNRTLTMREMETATDVRRPFGGVLAVTVSKPGGLTPGIHTIEAGVRLRGAGWPRTDPENLFPWTHNASRPAAGAAGTVKRKMTLVQ